MNAILNPANKNWSCPEIKHLEADVFAARVAAGEMRITSVGEENWYAVDGSGREFYAKDVLPICFVSTETR